MIWRPAKTLFEHTYPNGNRLHVTDKGFTLWDATKSRWTLDASTLIETDRFAIANEVVGVFQKCPVYWQTCSSLYKINECTPRYK